MTLNKKGMVDIMQITRYGMGYVHLHGMWAGYAWWSVCCNPDLSTDLDVHEGVRLSR